MIAYKISFFDADTLPANPKPFMIYLINENGVANAYATDADCRPKPLSNIELIRQLVAEKVLRWGDIFGSISEQADLQAELDLKLNISDYRNYYGTTVASLAITAGTKTFDTQSNLAYIIGQRVRLTYDSTNYMEGAVVGYTGTSMTVLIDYRYGSGTYSAWTLSPSTEQRVPNGGSAGQVLAKSSGTDYAVTWVTPSAGSGGGNSDYNNSFFLMGA